MLETDKGLLFLFQSPHVEISVEKCHTLLSNRVGSSTDVDKKTIFREFAAPCTDVIGVILDIDTCLNHTSSDCSRRVIALLPEKLEDPLIGLRQPVGVFPHEQRECRRKHRESVKQGIDCLLHKSHTNKTDTDSVSKELYCYSISCAIGTTCGPRYSGDTDVSRRQWPVVKRAPVLVPPARSGSDRQGVETVYDNVSGAIESPERQQASDSNSSTCPECNGPLSGIDTRGRGRHEAEPCGCQVSDAHLDGGTRVMADGGVSVHDLTGFQRDLLWTILDLQSDPATERTYGLALKEELERQYENEIFHGRLYPNLDELVEYGLVEKQELDRRTNEYRLTGAGRALLVDVAGRRERVLDRARDKTPARADGGRDE